MKKIQQALLLLFAVLFITNCNAGQYRADAVGTFGEVIVIMDSTAHQSATAEAIRSTFGHNIFTIPDAPRWMDLRFQSFSNNDQLERLKKFKNIIVAAPIDGKSNTSAFVRALLGKNAQKRVKAGKRFSFILKNKNNWYDNQWVLILTAPSDSILARKIKQNQEKLTRPLLQKEFSRWVVQVYEDREREKIENHLWENYGWEVRVKHDWSSHLDTTYTEDGAKQHLFTMQRISDDNDRRFWAWWTKKPLNLDTLSVKWIHQLRDEIWKHWFRGSEDSAYVTTSHRRPFVTDTLTVDGHTTFETRGVWRMVSDVMAGPFVSMLIYDEDTQRLFMIGYLQFAPSVDQRPYIRQYRAMLRTFRSDSTFTSSK